MIRAFVFILSILSATTFGFDTYKLKNDKDVLIRDIDINQVEYLKHKYSLEESIELFKIFSVVIEEQIKNPLRCEITLASEVQDIAYDRGLDPLEFIQALRVHNQIDDILYALVKDALDLAYGIESSMRRNARVRNYRYVFTPKVLKAIDIEKLYTGRIKEGGCIEASFNEVTNTLLEKGFYATQKQINLLNHKAYRQGFIDLSLFRGLQVLKNQKNKRIGIGFKKYFEVIKNAKNLMSQGSSERIEEVKNIFPSQYTDRHHKLTRRIKLYRKYNSTQIVMLSNVLKRVSMRMGIDPNTETEATRIVTNYVVRRDGEVHTLSDVYILSPSEQFEFARKRLRQDIFDLVGQKTFRGLKVNYEDIVMAALETGYINHSDLAYVIEFDDLWNPNISGWDRYKEFAWSFAGEAAFFLPAPYNVIGALGLVFLNSRYANKGAPHENHDNPGNIFH